MLNIVQINRASIARFILFYVISSAIITFYCNICSPLIPGWQGDYSIFYTISNAWLDGLVPYRDIFDHKGPFVYMIYCIGILIAPGKWGIFSLFSLFNAISLNLIYQTGKFLNTSLISKILAVLIAICMLMIFTEDGGSVEELSLPFQLLALYFGVKYLTNKCNAESTAIIIGLCFGATVLVRINNNCIICGILFGIAILMIKSKQYALLFKSIILFFCGALLIVTPFIIYFAYVGALEHLVYCTWTFNLHYKAAWPTDNNLADTISALIVMLPCILLPFQAWLFQKRQNINVFWISLMIGVITIATFITGARYSHYYLMIIPSASLCILYCMDYLPWNFIIIGCLSFLPIIRRLNLLIHPTFSNASHRVSTSNSLIELIPNEDYASVYCYGGFASNLQMLQIDRIPVGKYFFLQDKLSAVDSFVKNDIQSTFRQARPRWIISTVSLDTINQTIHETQSDYRLISPQKSSLYLYKLKDY